MSDQIQTAAETTETRKLETVTCSRCGGSGSYSYCPSYGTRCFKCHGRKVVYSKRGFAAAQYLESIRSRPVSSLSVGMTIRVGLVTMGGQPYDTFAIITAIRPQVFETDGGSCRTDENGKTVSALPEGALVIETNKVTLMQQTADTIIRIGLSAADKRETLTRALDYQDTLTKSGTVRKR